MKFLFQRRKKVPKSNGTVSHNSLSKIMEKGYYYLQSKWAEWMTTQTAKLSIRNQVAIFGFLIVCANAYSVYLIARSFSDTDFNSNSITVTSIVKPVKTYPTDQATTNKNSAIIKKEWNKIIRFRTYIDSLGRSPTGKKVLDSIKNQDPALLESLARIENYYQSNFKNDYHGK